MILKVGSYVHVLETTCKDHMVVSQKCPYHKFQSLLRDHLCLKDHVFFLGPDVVTSLMLVHCIIIYMNFSTSMYVYVHLQMATDLQVLLWLRSL
jgi:hypothetical protein